MGRGGKRAGCGRKPKFIGGSRRVWIVVPAQLAGDRPDSAIRAQAVEILRAADFLGNWPDASK